MRMEATTIIQSMRVTFMGRILGFEGKDWRGCF